MSEMTQRGILPLAGALALAAATAVDALNGFDLLHPATNVLILLLSAAIATRGARDFPRPPGRARAPLFAALLFAACAIALSADALLYRTRLADLPASWRSHEELRLGERAEALSARLSDLLTTLEEPVMRARDLAARSPRSGAPENPTRAFGLVRLLTAGRPAENPRLAVTIYGADRRTLAWSGPSRLLPPELMLLSIPEGTTKWLTVESDGLTRILALARPWKDSAALIVVELQVRSIYDIRTLETSFPAPAFIPDVDRISFTTYRQLSTPLVELFEQEGDRVSARGTERPTIHVALRSRDRGLLGYATLTGRSFEASSEDLLTRHRQAADRIVILTGLLLLALAILPRRRAAASVAREVAIQAARIAGVWALRGLLLIFPVPLRSGGFALDDPALFSSRAFGGLFNSPQDFLLTAMAVLATGVVISLTTSRLLLAGARFGKRRGAAICL